MNAQFSFTEETFNTLTGIICDQRDEVTATLGKLDHMLVLRPADQWLHDVRSDLIDELYELGRLLEAVGDHE